jgi:hypothetical protein
LQDYLQQFSEQLKTVLPLTLTILSELTLSFFMGNFARSVPGEMRGFLT